MATTKENIVSADPILISDPSLLPPDRPPDPPPDRLDIPLTTNGMKQTMDRPSDSSISPSIPGGSHNPARNLKILHLVNVPLFYDYDSINKIFCKFGQVKEIRMSFNSNSWDAWLSFATCESALEANRNLTTSNINEENFGSVTGALCDRAPRNLEIYKPEEWTEKPNERSVPAIRTPKPPSWIVISGNNDKYNYFRLKKCIQKRVGSIKSADISRYGRQSVLVHAKSEDQSIMLCSLKIYEGDLINGIRPHTNFSYGKGVVFDRDLCEFSEEEILDMCPLTVWRVSKVPRTNMIILSFDSPNVPEHVYVENERLHVREYKPRPMQCFNCFSFGHPSRFCKNNKICMKCSAADHGECNRDLKCVNCNLNHKATDKTCKEYKIEEAALLKSNAEHISIGAAKKQLNRQPNFARAVLGPRTSNNENLGTPAPFIPKRNTETTKITQRPISAKSSSTHFEGTTYSIKNSVTETTASVAVPEKLSPEQASKNTVPIDEAEVAITSQDSLPDLMDSEKQKRSPRKKSKRRGRPHSSSPPTSVSPFDTNRFEVLAEPNLHGKVEKCEKDIPKEKRQKVESYHSPQQEREGTSKPNNKPNITRTSLNQPSDSNKNIKKETGTREKQRTTSKSSTSGK